MKIIHNLGSLTTSKTAEDNVGFLLTNKKGSYCSFFSKPSSRYHGFFYFDEKSMEMRKFIENIEIVGSGEASLLKNGFYYSERIKDETIETFLVPKDFNSLIYELSENCKIDLVLDCKRSYDNREWGRYYETSEDENCIIIKFTKKTDKREDESDNKPEFSLYMAIRSDAVQYEKKDEWIERHYVDDEKRNSRPFKRYVYKALRLEGKRFVFSVSSTKEGAAKESEFIFNNLQGIKEQEKSHFCGMLGLEHVKKIISNKNIGNEAKAAYVNAANSLNNLAVHNKKHAGVLAGFPWFFQFWPRDALVSLKAFSKINRNIAERLLIGYLDEIGDGGRLPNLIGDHGSKFLGSADAVGWLFLRCSIIVDKINKDKDALNSIKKSMYWIKQSKLASRKNIKEYIKRCNSMISRKENEYFKLLYEVENALEKSINGLLKSYTKDGFEINDPLETWMDTEFDGDNRKGARIEMQSLRLNMYKLMFELTQNHKYKVIENTLKMKLRQKFWNGNMLADGLDDFTIRPNVFIASYAYPELLSPKEWELCFENALKALWLDWGGLSTIDKGHRLFTPMNTGEGNRSYHRGDSWFYLNNLAAVQLSKVNNKKFEKYIKKIVEASTEDILWKGCIGSASEISSARELSALGCFSQAWSNAMYMEMVEEIYSILIK